MKLTFCGAAKNVTGSNYLLESGSTKILIDCGLNQGSEFCDDLNYEKFPYEPEEITAVIITHAHIDHIGKLPKLVKEGFKGTIYSTYPTRDFAESMLLDTAHVLFEEAEKKGRPPLYDIRDIEKTMLLWQCRDYHEDLDIGPFSVELYDAGHVLGSASVLMRVENKKIVFSGDLGNAPAPFLKETEYPQGADFVLIESAYGDRLHEHLNERKKLLEETVKRAIGSGGVLMIPAFALERTQEMLFELNELMEKNSLPKVPVFVDSPLAIKLTEVYEKYSENPMYFNDKVIGLIKSGEDIFNFPGLRMTLTKDESKAINEVPPPKVVIAGAGMSNGGRILHHEMRYLPDPKSTLLIVGYQSVNSLGRKLLEGEKEISIFGEEIKVKAKVAFISGYSAHADQKQLLKWAASVGKDSKRVFIVQGEENSADALRNKIKTELYLNAEIPSLNETVLL